jgi:DNA-binding response OmpR family regulator
MRQTAVAVCFFVSNGQDSGINAPMICCATHLTVIYLLLSHTPLFLFYTRTVIIMTRMIMSYNGGAFMIKKVMLVEDDPSIAEMVVDHLNKEGYVVIYAMDGEEALQLFNEESINLILLDLMLPGLDGMDFLRTVREKSFIPILILSAKDSDIDKALGLGFGADDYVVKPFSLVELSARIKAALRRATRYSRTDHPEESNVIRIHALTIDTEHFNVSKNEKEVNLTAKEFHILKLLATNPKRAFSKEQIYRAVWNDDYFGDENAIQVHISRLREKIEDDPSSPQYIKTVWGIGYKLGDY